MIISCKVFQFLLFARKSLSIQTNLAWGVCYCKVQHSAIGGVFPSPFSFWMLSFSWFWQDCKLCDFVFQSVKWLCPRLANQSALSIYSNCSIPVLMGKKSSAVFSSFKNNLTSTIENEAKTDETESERWSFLMKTFKSLKPAIENNHTSWVSWAREPTDFFQS